MAARTPFTAGQLQDMLKQGSKHMSGMEEAIFRNINVGCHAR